MIVARVRASPKLQHILIEALVLALALGVVSNRLLGLPVSVCFFATLSLLGEAIRMVYVAEAHKLYTEWTAFRRQAYLVVGVLIGTRLLVGQALPIATPAAVYAEIVGLGGFPFWDNTGSNVILLEMCLDVLLLMMSVQVVVEKSRKAQRLLIAIALVSILRPLISLFRALRG